MPATPTLWCSLLTLMVSLPFVGIHCVNAVIVTPESCRFQDPWVMLLARVSQGAGVFYGEHTEEEQW